MAFDMWYLAKKKRVKDEGIPWEDRRIRVPDDHAEDPELYYSTLEHQMDIYKREMIRRIAAAPVPVIHFPRLQKVLRGAHDAAKDFRDELDDVEQETAEAQAAGMAGAEPMPNVFVSNDQALAACGFDRATMGNQYIMQAENEAEEDEAEEDDAVDGGDRHERVRAPTPADNPAAREVGIDQAYAWPMDQTLFNKDHFVLVDLDNWPSFFRDINPFPRGTFVWFFYGGATSWVPPEDNEAYSLLEKDNSFHINPHSGLRKNAADLFLSAMLGKLTERYERAAVTLVSGDRGMHDVARLHRSVNIIDPHRNELGQLNSLVAYKHPDEEQRSSPPKNITRLTDFPKRKY